MDAVLEEVFGRTVEEFTFANVENPVLAVNEGEIFKKAV